MALFNVTSNYGVSLYTSFLVGPTPGDACISFDGSPFSLTLYHNGVNPYPEVGDTIFTDAAGTTPYTGPNDLQMANLAYLRVDGSGIVQLITCK